MSKKLAIKGHSTRGNEVIELLKMMGGKNNCNSTGDNLGLCYLIDDETDIVRQSVGYVDYEDGGLNIFTLEEFLEKYPFKVGDIVDRTLDYVSCVIDGMRWNSEKCCVEYHLNYLNGSEYGWHVSECLNKHENEDVIIGTKVESTGFMQIEKTCGIIFNEANYADEVELQLGDYKIEVRDGKTFAVNKKPKYPKTYEECCKNYPDNEKLKIGNLLCDLEQLIICRNAYWKIAGEEMGLGKPWDPTYGCGEWGYWFGYSINENKIYLQDSRILVNHTLVFPTKEMRDVFYENFKHLIEQCKELL